MNTTLPFELPEELIARTADIPGFATRLRLWVRAEVTQHEKRRFRHSEEARAIVDRAYQRAETLKAAGRTPEQARQEFAQRYEVLMDKL